MKKEQTIIVDDEDNIVGYKDRDKIDWKKDIYRVSALWLTNSKGEILLAQRSKNKTKDPGTWGPAAAGTVEKGESYEENIIKEMEEEIGLASASLKLGPKVRISSPRNYFTQWYIAKADKEANEFKVQKEEVEQVKWFSVDFLVKDVKENPSRYIPSMPKILKVFGLIIE